MTSSPASRPHEDPGLQPERTTQSWLRTSLTLIVVSLLFIRWIHIFHASAIAIFVLCLALAIAAIALQVRRYRLGVHSIRVERGRPTPLAVLFLTASVCLIAALGVATVLEVTVG
ncbi:uncharacterized protein DUF202 [Brevibacterium sanguinis]|uniref:Uncharacterized protein DUF202 n=2 Tax=Brevibacterium TaxID=1696 RepID=A0A366IG05_9MICO|nr:MULTISPECIES: DUF202 domain-containing protein [Brevibacterium]RBP63644.1 uncharacterized protein DUF202 [Brevibacterium sanguinis]RBP70303.1 uncharacterized protein DUF202 [Brevibacterium celere]